jgi:hypothetical protein
VEFIQLALNGLKHGTYLNVYFQETGSFYLERMTHANSSKIDCLFAQCKVDDFSSRNERGDIKEEYSAAAFYFPLIL